VIILPALTVAQGNGKNFRADGTPAFSYERYVFFCGIFTVQYLLGKGKFWPEKRPRD